MKLNYVLLTAFLSLALGTISCTNETEWLSNNGVTPMSIQVKNKVSSRGGLVTSNTLPADDYGIGVTLVNKSDKKPYDGQTGYANTQWKTTDGSIWNMVGENVPNLSGTDGIAVAYYPYSSTATDYTAIPVESATQTDYMYSGWSNDLNNLAPQAEFTMQHALAVVRVKLAVSANYTGDKSATAVTIASDGFMAAASLNAETGALTGKTGAGAEHTQEELALELDVTGKDVDFLVIPADAPAEITFIATIGDKQYAASVTPGEALAQGLIHTYTLTLSATGMKVSTINVTPWGNGLTGSADLRPCNPWEKIANGVYAVSATGEPVDYTTAEANSTCIGVALITDNQKIMIAKQDATDGTNSTLYWGYNLIGKNDVTGVNVTVGEKDFDGKQHTAAILEAYNKHSVEMDTRDMSFVLNMFNTNKDTNCGFTDWYIPACGQLYEIYTNITNINTAMRNIGGTEFASQKYWSSSENNSSYGWFVVFSNGVINYNSTKNYTGCVRYVRNIS